MLDSTLVSVSTSVQCFGRVVEDVLTLGHIIRVWLVWVLCHEVKRPFCIRPFTNGHGWWYRHISPTLLVKHRAHCYACCYCERNLCNATFVFVSIYMTFYDTFLVWMWMDVWWEMGLPILASWAWKASLWAMPWERMILRSAVFSNSWYSVQSGEIETRDPSCTKCGKEIFGPVDGDQFGILSILHFTGAVRCFLTSDSTCSLVQGIDKWSNRPVTNHIIIFLDGQNAEGKKITSGWIRILRNPGLTLLVAVCTAESLGAELVAVVPGVGCPRHLGLKHVMVWELVGFLFGKFWV